MTRARPPKKCRRCGAPILWWLNANRDGAVCVDLSSDRESGTVQRLVVDGPDGPKVFGKVLSGRALADAVSDPTTMLFTLHAATCSADRPHNPKPAGLQLNLKNSRRRS